MRLVHSLRSGWSMSKVVSCKRRQLLSGCCFMEALGSAWVSGSGVEELSRPWVKTSLQSHHQGRRAVVVTLYEPCVWTSLGNCCSSILSVCCFCCALILMITWLWLLRLSKKRKEERKEGRMKKKKEGERKKRYPCKLTWSGFGHSLREQSLLLVP